MKRFAAALSVVAGLTAAMYLISFTASKYRVQDQSYLRSLSDYSFMIGTYNAQALGFSPPDLDDRSYERVMSHTRSTSHHEVDDRVVWSLVRWGESVGPRLVREIESASSPARSFAAAKALAELRYAPALTVLERALLEARGDRRREIDLIEALGAFGPETAPMLIETFQWYRESDLGQPYNLLDAIGETRGAVDFLLAEMESAERAHDVDRIMLLEWPLAFTQDPRAARKLVSLLHHPVLEVRRRARDSMSQSMGVAAIVPAVELLETETDDYVRLAIIESILASRNAAGSERAVELLGDLLDDPVLGNRANYALARIGSDRAIEELRTRAADQTASWVMHNLEYSGTTALRILEPYLEDDDPYVRWQTVSKLEEIANPEAIPLLTSRLSDPDPRIRRSAESALRGMDLLLLEASFVDWLANKTGERLGRFQRRRTDVVFTALGWVHWLGLGISVALGLCLLSGWLRAFEPFKFALVIQFLIVEGLIGDLVLMNTSEGLYRWSTAGRLVLLLGLLFLRDDPLPGETRGRIERLVVRSLWVLVPMVLVLGAPLFASALRHSLRDFDFMKWAILLLAVITVLILEQAFLPWHLFARSGRLERGMTFLLSAGVCSLFASALWRSTMMPSADANRTTLSGLVLAPLLVALVFHLKTSRLLAKRETPLRQLSEPPGRIRVIDDGESLLIRLQHERRFRALPLVVFALLFVAIAWWMHTTLRVASGGGPAMFLMIVLSILGTAMGSLVVSGFSGLTLQIRDGAIRSASTFLGGAFGTTAWHGHLRVPAFLGRLSFGSAEKRWLSSALAPPSKSQKPELRFLLAVGSKTAGQAPATAPFIPMELRVENTGTVPTRLADVESAEGSPFTAQVNGRNGDVYFSRAERETVIEPGATRTFRPRLYGVTGRGPIVLRCGAGGPLAECA